MPANLGEMFWYGESPWHGQGRQVPRPLTWEEALDLGGLNWRVEEASLWVGGPGRITRAPMAPRGQRSPEGPMAYVTTRKALFRSDRDPEYPSGVVGIVHNDFVPLQNREGIEVFDGVFGCGQAIYETGGWLGNGERVWLLARAGDKFEALKGDEVGRFILFANSHDGSTAIRVRRTAVRVVCQNTFTLALAGRSGAPEVRLRHAAQPEALRRSLEKLRAAWAGEEAAMIEAVRFLARKPAPAGGLEEFLDALFPLPASPAQGASRAVVRSYERRLEEAKEARKIVVRLTESGKGVDLPGLRGTPWWLFNALTEYVDHHAGGKKSGPDWSLFGGGEALKAKAWIVAQDLARAA